MTGHDGDERAGRLRRFARRRVDEVVPRFTVDLPLPAQGRRSGDGALAEAERRERRGLVRMLDRDAPRGAGRAHTAHAHVAAEVDAHAGRAFGDELVDDDVGRESLADATGIEAGADRQRDCIRGDEDAFRAGLQNAATAARVLAHRVERAVVAGAHERAVHGRVEPTVAQEVRVERACDQFDRVAGNGHE